MHRSAALLAAAALLGAATVQSWAADRFKPRDGRYVGHYTSSKHGPGALRLRVEPLRPRLHGVRVIQWSGKLRCPDGSVQEIEVPMTAARAGRTFSGFRTFAGGKDTLVGRFTSRTTLEGTMRVVRGEGEQRCDTGRVTFVARRASG